MGKDRKKVERGEDTGFFELYIGWGEVKGQGGVKKGQTVDF